MCIARVPGGGGGSLIERWEVTLGPISMRSVHLLELRPAPWSDRGARVDVEVEHPGDLASEPQLVPSGSRDHRGRSGAWDGSAHVSCPGPAPTSLGRGHPAPPQTPSAVCSADQLEVHIVGAGEKIGSLGTGFSAHNPSAYPSRPTPTLQSSVKPPPPPPPRGCGMQMLDANLRTPRGKRLQSNTVRTQSSSVTLP